MAHPSFFQRVAQAALWAVAPQNLMQRRYDAARIMSDRNARFTTFAPEVAQALQQSRSKSRYYAENNSYVSAAHRALGTHLVGAEIVAASTHPDPATQALLNEAWTRFCAVCDYDGLTNMGGMQSALVGDWIRDGEAVAIMHTTAEGLRVQRIAADQIDDSATRDLGGGAFVQSGVEFDSAGRKVAFHLFAQNPANTSAMNLQSVRVDAADVIHLFEPRGPGQCRGMPVGVSALKRVAEIDQLEDALLVGTKTAAMFCGVVTDESAQAEPPFEGVQTGTEVLQKLAPGTMLHVNGAGKKVTFTTPQQATQGVEFLASQIRAVASAYGVPPQFVDSDYARTNFSSLKSALAIYASRLDQIVHTILRPMVLDRLWRRWIVTEILAGRIDAPTFESDPSPWCGVEWYPPSPPVADDEKAAKADVLQIANGLKSRSQAIRERGYAPEALDAEIAAERERAQALGLSFAAPAKEQQPEENDDDSGDPPDKS